MEFLVRYLVLICLFSVRDGFKLFGMGIFCKNIKLILEFLEPPFLFQHLAYYTSFTYLLMICNIAIYADDISFCSKCDQACDLWQQLELASEI